MFFLYLAKSSIVGPTQSEAPPSMMIARRLLLYEVLVIHKTHRLNAISTANTLASVNLQQNFLISEGCSSEYAKAIYNCLVTVKIFKIKSKSLWTCNNLWRWLSACCKIVSFVLCGDKFHIALCQFLICFKSRGFCDIEVDCIRPPDSSKTRSYTSSRGLVALKSVYGVWTS